MTLCDPAAHPALYAASVDTIRMTNHYLHLLAPYSNDLTHDLVQRNAQILQRKRPKLWLPPDLRSLYVLHKDGVLIKPTDTNSRLVWVKAWKEYRKLSDLEKWSYLTSTKEQHVRQHHLFEERESDRMVVRFFKRYLVWKEHVDKHLKDPVQYPHQQPSQAQLEALFNKPEIKEKGISLADICQHFPYAFDTQQLVDAIHPLAIHTPQPDYINESITELTESTYIPRPQPLTDVPPSPTIADVDVSPERQLSSPSPSGTKRKPRSDEDETEDEEPAFEPPTKKAKTAGGLGHGDVKATKCCGLTRQGRPCKMKKKVVRGQKWNCGRHKM